MSQGVKTIFKVLIGTAVILVVGALALEWYNISVSGMQLKQCCTMAANQSCELYTQETYKVKGGAYSTQLPAIVAPDGTVYISGNIYVGSNTASIWTGIHTSSNFYNFAKMAPGGSFTYNHVTYYFEHTNCADNASNYYNEFAGYGGFPAATQQLRYMFPYLNRLVTATDPANYATLSTHTHFTKSITYSEYNSGSSRIVAYNAAKSALRMRNEMYTPVNLGVPYFDANTLTRTFRWNVTQLLTNSDSDNIHVDEAGQYYVAYKGFRCYTSRAIINELHYYVLDTANSSDAALLQQMTGIKSGALVTASEGLTTVNSTSNMYTGAAKAAYDRSNRIVTVVGISYSIPITYEGITPLRQIFAYGWRSEAQSNMVDGYSGGQFDYDDFTATEDLQYQYDIDNLSNRSAGGAGGLISTTGDLYYVLVK